MLTVMRVLVAQNFMFFFFNSQSFADKRDSYERKELLTVFLCPFESVQWLGTVAKFHALNIRLHYPMYTRNSKLKNGNQLGTCIAFAIR
jgi:hypothetical protein